MAVIVCWPILVTDFLNLLGSVDLIFLATHFLVLTIQGLHLGFMIIAPLFQPKFYGCGLDILFFLLISLGKTSLIKDFEKNCANSIPNPIYRSNYYDHLSLSFNMDEEQFWRNFETHLFVNLMCFIFKSHFKEYFVNYHFYLHLLFILLLLKEELNHLLNLLLLFCS